MTQPTFGIVIQDDTSGVQPTTPADLSVVGILATSEDAVAQTFPLNTPVSFNSTDTTYLAAAGTGDLYDSLALLNAQLKGIGARVVAVRVTEGTNDSETIANILGNQAGGTGIYAFLRAGQLLGVTPRIILIPKYTGIFSREDATATVVSAAKTGGNTGTGTLVLATPSYGASVKTGVYRVRCTATAVNGGTFSVTDPDGVALANASVGVAYTGNHVKFTLNDGLTDFAVGDGFDLTATVTGGVADANPIVAALPPVLEALFATAYVDGPMTTKQDALDWRETITSKRIFPVDCPLKVQKGVDTITLGLATAAAGIRVQVDYDNGGVPAQSGANQPIQGIIGLGRYDNFALNDGATDAQELLAQQIGVAVRGEQGVDTSIADSGFVSICLFNAGDDAANPFDVSVRMDDYIKLGLFRSLRKRLGRTNITIRGITAVENDMMGFGQNLKALGYLLSWKVGFEKDKNSSTELLKGHFRLFYKKQIAPPLTLITLDNRNDPSALDEMLDTLLSQANTLVAS